MVINIHIKIITWQFAFNNPIQLVQNADAEQERKTAPRKNVKHVTKTLSAADTR